MVSENVDSVLFSFVSVNGDKWWHLQAGWFLILLR